MSILPSYLLDGPELSMHRLATQPGGWQPGNDGVIFIDQTPAPLVILTAADTDIQALNRGLALAPPDLAAVRVASLLNLQQQLTIDTYAADVLSQAQGILLRILGGRAYWSYGLEVVKALAAETGCALAVLPGDDRPDLDLMSHSTLSLTAVNHLWQYFVEGGPENLCQALLFFSDCCLSTNYSPMAAKPIRKVGIYTPGMTPLALPNLPLSPQAAVLFYRAHYLAGNTAPIDALITALRSQQLSPIAIYVSSLKDSEIQQELLSLLKSVDLVLNTTSFAIADLQGSQPGFWQTLDVPVLQVILSGGSWEQWQQRSQGLAPRDMAMNVALPEVDGRIITRAVSFKSVEQQDSPLETDVVTYQPACDRIQFVATLAANWVRLRCKPAAERKIAIILANYPNRDSRLANGVGLDTPASCIAILQALSNAGYTLENLPVSGDDLIQQLTQTYTNDPEGFGLRKIPQTLSLSAYQTYFEQLPSTVQQALHHRWGSPQEEIQRFYPLQSADTMPAALPIAGLSLGNIFVGIQPSRGYDLDPSLNYHAPDLEPTHSYLAFYHWLRTVFQADAIVHVGKHGNLEWLPGKSIALSETCYPEIAFGPIPHLYPFIVNDPGEGAQAKRRAQAVIIDHLTPPLTRAELYGPLQQIENLVDEYYDAQAMDPKRVPVIEEKIAALLVESRLIEELGQGDKGTRGQGDEDVGNPDFSERPSKSKIQNLAHLLPQIDGYLCELKEAQIRDGLHIFGQRPNGRQLQDLVVAIARHPSRDRIGLTRAIAQSCGLDFDPLTADPAIPLSEDLKASLPTFLAHCRTPRDLIDSLEQHARDLVAQLLSPSPATASQPQNPTQDIPITHYPLPITPPSPTTPQLQTELSWLQSTLLPALNQTPQELTHLLRGLNGRYVPAGPAGAPTRNRPEVLPTGRNFYSVDIRALPTESAWEVGRKAAEILVETYTQEHGEYPRTLGLSLWGTAAMRTGGDDLAEALALLGVRPVWDGPSRRVVDFEILPLSALGRPRVDVTLRISGFFRDAFSNLIDLFDQAVTAVAALAESPEQNPLAAQVQQETAYWQQQGLDAEQARLRSQLRIFGSKPGAYGAGLQGLIEAQNWSSEEDLARAYINWSSYAYTREGIGKSAPEAFQQRLAQMQIVLHNQDNREHDLLDSDDYYQFQGGLTAAVKAISSQQPQTYFGDNAIAEHPKVRTLKAEIARVYRSRVVNPKWITGVMRHGYKGAFEMAATLDYLFAYDATTGGGADYMYEGITQTYLLDPEISTFIQKSNPWALRDMAERLLEAHQRKLWTTANPDILETLRNIAHAAEGIIENNQFLTET